MAYVKTFKSFEKEAKKAAEISVGANPSIDEQAAQPVAQTPATTTPAPTSPSPAVQAAQKQVTDIDAQIAALNSQIAGLQAKRATAQATVNAAAAQKA